jgi:hypothetical protein
LSVYTRAEDNAAHGKKSDSPEHQGLLGFDQRLG